MCYVFKVLLILWIPITLVAQDSLSILYIANINGTLESCKCGKQPLGGVDRCKTIIEQYRRSCPNLLVISGGDYFNSYSFLALNSALLAALPLLQFDIFVPGDQEFVEGKQFMAQMRTILDNRFFLSNTGKSVPKLKTFNYIKQHINIYAYLSPACFSFIHQPEDLVLNLAQPVFPDDDPDSFNLIIYHGLREEACTLARNNPKLPLILMSHEQFTSSDTIGHTLLIGAGKDAEFIVLLQISRSNTTWKITQSRIALTESIPVDDDISSLIKTYKNSINRETN